MSETDRLQELWCEYNEALLEADPHQVDGILGACVGQDAKHAVRPRVRQAAQTLLDAGVPYDDCA